MFNKVTVGIRVETETLALTRVRACSFGCPGGHVGVRLEVDSWLMCRRECSVCTCLHTWVYVTKVKTGDLWCGGGNYCQTGQMDPASDSKDVGGLRETSLAGELGCLREPSPLHINMIVCHFRRTQNLTEEVTVGWQLSVIKHSRCTLYKRFTSTQRQTCWAVWADTHITTQVTCTDLLWREHHETTQEPFRAHVKPRSRVVCTKVSHRHTHTCFLDHYSSNIFSGGRKVKVVGKTTIALFACQNRSVTQDRTIQTNFKSDPKLSWKFLLLDNGLNPEAQLFSKQKWIQRIK